MQDELIRKLPFSMPAEQSLLGSILIDPEALKEVADLLGISQSYISRLEKKIMKRLKKEIETKI